MCERCPELEERIAWLESELGVQKDAATCERIHRALCDSTNGVGKPQAAKIIRALYAAKGRPVSKFQLMEAVPPRDFTAEDERDPKLVDVLVCYARKALGGDSIANVWGKGWYLTAAGMAKVGAILNPDPEATIIAFKRQGEG